MKGAKCIRVCVALVGVTLSTCCAARSSELMVLRWSGSHGYPPGQPHCADVFHSTSGGSHWEQRGQVLAEYPYDDMGLDIEYSPLGILHAVLWDRDHVATTFRSFDGGFTWETAGIIRNDYSHWDAVSAALACVSENLLYAVLWSLNVTTGCELYASADSGKTWQLRSTFAEGLAGQDKNIGFVAGPSGNLYALIWNTGGLPRVYGSLDGLSWTELGVVDWVFGGLAYCGASLAYSGGNSYTGKTDALVAGLWTCENPRVAPLVSYYSTDGGVNWNSGGTVVTAHLGDGTFSFTADREGSVYATAWTSGLKASCFHSSDQGRSWTYRGEIFPTLPYDWTAGIAIDALTIQPPPETARLDIKPTSCPNPLNTRSKGVLPVAVLGTKDFDVSSIDVSTVLLEGVGPLRSALEDVAAPLRKELAPALPKETSGIGGLNVSTLGAGRAVHAPGAASPAPVGTVNDQCECTTEGPDGFLDLTLKFDKQEVVSALGDVADRDTILLTLTAQLANGEDLEVSDCVVILKKEEKEVCSEEKRNPQMESNRFSMETMRPFLECSPNPVRTSTFVRFGIPRGGVVGIGVYDLSGDLVRVVLEDSRPAGCYSVRWSDADLPSGIYFLRMDTQDFSVSRKLLVIR